MSTNLMQGHFFPLFSDVYQRQVYLISNKSPSGSRNICLSSQLLSQRGSAVSLEASTSEQTLEAQLVEKQR